MIEIDDYVDVPYLQEILSYMPINPIDDEDIVSYVQNIANVITVNYKYEQYQFAYMGVHLLYMTYIYCSIWKISKINPERYSDAIIFARPYSGRERDIDLDNIGSIFNFSLMPEKEFAKVFKIIGLDKSQITNVGGLVDIRNDMAHASGKFEILTEDSFSNGVNSVINSIRNIHNSMDTQVRVWFTSMLSDYCKDALSDYDNVSDIINEQMVQGFKLSINEMLVCKEMSMKTLIEKFPHCKDSLKEFKAATISYCENMGYI